MQLGNEVSKGEKLKSKHRLLVGCNRKVGWSNVGAHLLLFQMESWLLFPSGFPPALLRQRFRTEGQFLKEKISQDEKEADGKMNSNKDRVYRSTPDKWEFESNSKPHYFWKSTPVINNSKFKLKHIFILVYLLLFVKLCLGFGFAWLGYFDLYYLFIAVFHHFCSWSEGAFERSPWSNVYLKIVKCI